MTLVLCKGQDLTFAGSIEAWGCTPPDLIYLQHLKIGPFPGFSILIGWSTGVADAFAANVMGSKLTFFVFPGEMSFLLFTVPIHPIR